MTTALACPYCAEPLFTEDVFCEACGGRVAAETAVPQRSRPGGGCVWCAAAVSDGYCEGCGLRQPAERDHMEICLDLAAGASDRGLRHIRNEDAMALVRAAVRPSAMAAVVCDGVSSSPRSDEASRAGADAGAKVLAQEHGRGMDAATATRTALAQAADAVAALAASPAAAPACTYVSALVQDDAGNGAAVTIGWVGDSRAYWIPSGPPSGPALLTRDDSWAEQMVASGALTREQAWRSREAHALTAWLGADADELEAHVVSVSLNGPGAILICSDGLWNYFPEPGALAEAVPRPAEDPQDSVRNYVRRALEAGGHDNITAVVIPIPAPSDPPGSR